MVHLNCLQTTSMQVLPTQLWYSQENPSQALPSSETPPAMAFNSSSLNLSFSSMTLIDFLVSMMNKFSLLVISWFVLHFLSEWHVAPSHVKLLQDKDWFTSSQTIPLQVIVWQDTSVHSSVGEKPPAMAESSNSLNLSASSIIWIIFSFMVFNLICIGNKFFPFPVPGTPCA